MPATIVIGAQWGDEGKGGAVDRLAEAAEVVARFNGGDNAGHTINIGAQVYKLHLVPSGILRPGVICILGNGMVVNPVSLLKEIDELAALGVEISPERLMLSDRAHIVTPAHIALDAAQERARGDKKLGTTLRGIGPAYLDKAGRKGLRAGAMRDLEGFADALYAAIEAASTILTRDGGDPLNPQASAEAYLRAAERLRPYVRDTAVYLNQQLAAGARVVCEGGQGALLDIDHGSYPFVTASSSISGGALIGLGIGPTQVDRVLGVAKTFTTRVGGGAMPTELDGPLADRLRGTGANFWDEYGTTTGRARRCGWLDAVVLRYSKLVNGFTELALTKLDVLTGFDELKIAVAYEIDGARIEYPPSEVGDLERATPIYETFAGWHDDISAAREIDDLPPAARAYVARIGELVETRVVSVSVGPERGQVVMLDGSPALAAR
jgi:adenylosuccinate synthase